MLALGAYRSFEVVVVGRLVFGVLGLVIGSDVISCVCEGEGRGSG